MNKEVLFQLYGIFSPSKGEKKMRKFVKRYIRRVCGECDIVQDSIGNVFVTKGVAESYPCVAAHLDQVQRNHSKDFEVIEGKDVVFGYSAKSRAQQGLGADDKNGIWVAIECLRKYDVLKAAFFVGEEIGCVGSSACDLSFFSDCRYVIQPDRMNGNDLITSMAVGDVCSKAFVSALGAAAYGYKEAHGSITDVGTLVERGVGISCLNVSCGYYNAHTDNEFTVLSELQNCLDFVCHIIETLTDVYPYEYKGWRISYGYTHKPKGKDYWMDGYYDEDCDMMDAIVQGQPGITFDEIFGIGGWLGNFHTHDIDILRGIYDDIRLYYGKEKYDDCFWNGEYNDDELPFPAVKKVS